jgi:hypothetical protein
MLRARTRPLGYLFHNSHGVEIYGGYIYGLISLVASPISSCFVLVICHLILHESCLFP